jgi:hypothetical protein
MSRIRGLYRTRNLYFSATVFVLSAAQHLEIQHHRDIQPVMIAIQQLGTKPFDDIGRVARS